MGRRRIKMEMVKDIGSRQVTFSKRRAGLFKKANELATLCAADVAIIVFSPGGKPFSYGNPSVDAVAGRFLNEESSNPSPAVPDSVDEAQRARIEELNQQLEDVMKELDEAKKRGEMLDEQWKKVRESGAMHEFLKPFDEMTIPEAVKMMEALKELQTQVGMRKNEMEASDSLLLLSNGPPKVDAAADGVTKNKK